MVTTRPPKTIVKPTALGPVANTDTKLLIYGLFQKGRVLAQDGSAVCTFHRPPESAIAEGVAMDWKTMLNYIAGFVDEELLLRNEYLVAENRVLRNQTQGRLRLTDGERRSLAELGKSLQRPVTSSPSAKVHSCERLGGCSVSTIGKPHEYFDLTTFESRGRFTERLRTASCCRRATFSRASSRRALNAEMRARTNDEIMPAW